MKQSHLLVKQLKKLMKSSGISYLDLANKLGLSESSVKRIFSQGTFTLNRLDEICEILGIEFYDLAKIIKTSTQEDQRSLTPLQEQALAQDEKFFSYFYLLASGLKPQEIIKHFQFSQEDSVRMLLKLDKLNLIQYHSDKKIKLLFSRNFQWLKNGPLNRIYEEKVKSEFLESHFNQTNEYLNFFSGYFTEQDIKTLNRKIKKLISEIHENSEFNSQQSKVNKIWLLFAYRPWSFSQVSKWSRKTNR